MQRQGEGGEGGREGGRVGDVFGNYQGKECTQVGELVQRYL